MITKYDNFLTEKLIPKKIAESHYIKPDGKSISLVRKKVLLKKEMKAELSEKFGKQIAEKLLVL